MIRNIVCRLAIAASVALAVSPNQAHGQAQWSAARTWNEQNLSAIRLSLPNPPAHARNLFHTAVAMYDAWAAYDPTAVGYVVNEKISPLPADVEAARAEAVSYAAYRVLRSRYNSGTNASTIVASLDNQMTSLGFSTTIGQGSLSNATTPSELGKRIGQAVLNWGAVDGFSQVNFPQAYTSSVNPNVALPMSVEGATPYASNTPLGVGIPNGTNPNYWQPLDLATSITQNGQPQPGGPQTFVGVQSLATKAFSLTRSDPTKPWSDPFGGPAYISPNGQPTNGAYKTAAADVLQHGALLNDQGTVDISPGTIGNNTLGTDNGHGYTTNPVTGNAYAANPVIQGDFGRCVAEFWADGPNSETPPGHWHVLANEIADDPQVVKKIRGAGPLLNNLEWDVKVYFSLAASVHDAACSAWSLKRYYNSARPITMIRYMGSLGQSSDPNQPSYNVDGLPLIPNVCELITNASAAAGGHHEQVWNLYTLSYDAGVQHIGEMAVYAWPGENPNNLPAPSIATNQNPVRWMLAKDWLPYQRKTFVTPSFPGYASGHSSFSRAGAEALALITGSTYFPGGFHHHTIQPNTMQTDLGPSAAVDLQWATFYDAADQAGQARRWGGIHPSADDYDARVLGSQAGISAYTLAEKYWTANIQSTTTVPTVTIQADGSALVTWTATVGQFQKVQTSTDQVTWTDASTKTYEYTTGGSATIAAANVVPGAFYQIITTAPSAARTWNEQNLAAIRLALPNPPAHARNLLHTNVAMYDAWAAYDTTAVGYIYNEKISPLPSGSAAIEAARAEAISYAAYRVLRNRYSSGTFAATTLAALDAQMTALGYDPAVGQGATSSATTPSELGKRIGQAILNWGASDQFSNVNFPQAYTTAVNPNMDPNLAMDVLGNNGQSPSVINMQLGVGIPGGMNPNYWQPLSLSTVVTQNGQAQPGGIQTFVGVQSLATVPFSLTRSDSTQPWFDPGPPSALSFNGATSATDASYKAQALTVLELGSKINSTDPVNISPGVFGNNSLGTDDGTGRPTNPVTGAAYADNIVQLGDFGRSLAEFWADGPNSETPPGHWHVLANQVADDPLIVKKIRGTGPLLNDLEWDIKAYFAIAGAVHDAACAAWSVKRYYNGPRPITMIRYMGTQGQSSDPNQPSYNVAGLPLEPGVVEVVTQDSANNGDHQLIWNMYTQSYDGGSSHIGDIVVKAWPGENPNNAPAPSIATFSNPVRWMPARDWQTYQRKTFNTPSFPGYISGHSAFSRAAAEALTLLTGSPNFPGGFHHFVKAVNTLSNDLGPSAPVDLQWATYYDAADQAGLSRRWGGIHIPEDDYAARRVGSKVGITAYNLAEKYWTGTIQNDTINPAFGFINGGGVVVKWNTTRGMYYKVQVSSDLSHWTDLTTSTQYYDTTATVTDPTAPSGPRFYRVLRSNGP